MHFPKYVFFLEARPVLFAFCVDILTSTIPDGDLISNHSFNNILIPQVYISSHPSIIGQGA